MDNKGKDVNRFFSQTLTSQHTPKMGKTGYKYIFSKTFLTWKCNALNIIKLYVY